MESAVSCNLCASTRFTPYTEKRGSSTGRLFRIVRCDCGLMFVDPRLSADENRALYDADYFNGHGFDTSVNYVKLKESGDVARRGENRGVLEKIRALKPGLQHNILDVGCGTGSLLAALMTAGYRQVSGVEFSEYAARIARDSSGARVHVGDFLQVDFGEERFDVINATEVVEHVRDPLSFFRRVKSLLRPRGVFIYSTGNAESAYARTSGSHWPYLNPEGHLFYYTPSTLARYFEVVGLKPIPLSTLESPLRSTIERAEGSITHSQIVYVGQSSGGLKGLLFRFAGRVPSGVVGRALARFQGRLELPIAINPG